LVVVVIAVVKGAEFYCCCQALLLGWLGEPSAADDKNTKAFPCHSLYSLY
jgi:hypothetical protein